MQKLKAIANELKRLAIMFAAAIILVSLLGWPFLKSSIDHDKANEQIMQDYNTAVAENLQYDNIRDIMSLAPYTGLTGEERRRLLRSHVRRRFHAHAQESQDIRRLCRRKQNRHDGSPGDADPYGRRNRDQQHKRRSRRRRLTANLSQKKTDEVKTNAQRTPRIPAAPHELK